MTNSNSKELGPQSGLCTACGKDLSVPEHVIPGCSVCSTRPAQLQQAIVDPPTLRPTVPTPHRVPGLPQVGEDVLFVLPNGKIRPAKVIDVPEKGDGQPLLRVMSAGANDGKGFERDQNLLAPFSPRKEANTWHRRSV